MTVAEALVVVQDLRTLMQQQSDYMAGFTAMDRVAAAQQVASIRQLQQQIRAIDVLVTAAQGQVH